MAHLITQATGVKIVFLILALGAQPAIRSMQLLATVLRPRVKRGACLPFVLPDLALPKMTTNLVHAPLGVRLCSSSRENRVSPESWLVAHQLLLQKADKQAQDLTALIAVMQGHVNEQMYGERQFSQRATMQTREERATIALNSMYLQLSQAEQWAYTCIQRVMDLEHGGRPLSEQEQQNLAFAHKDEREAAINVRKAKEGIMRAQLELRAVQKQFNTVPV